MVGADLYLSSQALLSSKGQTIVHLGLFSETQLTISDGPVLTAVEDDQVHLPIRELPLCGDGLSWAVTMANS